MSGNTDPIGSPTPGVDSKHRRRDPEQVDDDAAVVDHDQSVAHLLEGLHPGDGRELEQLEPEQAQSEEDPGEGEQERRQVEPGDRTHAQRERDVAEKRRHRPRDQQEYLSLVHRREAGAEDDEQCEPRRDGGVGECDVDRVPGAEGEQGDTPDRRRGHDRARPHESVYRVRETEQQERERFGDEHHHPPGNEPGFVPRVREREDQPEYGDAPGDAQGETLDDELLRERPVPELDAVEQRPRREREHQSHEGECDLLAPVAPGDKRERPGDGGRSPSDHRRRRNPPAHPR